MDQKVFSNIFISRWIAKYRLFKMNKPQITANIERKLKSKDVETREPFATDDSWSRNILISYFRYTKMR